jgi:PIN domain nuclease of toxin-antitoxin system
VDPRTRLDVEAAGVTIVPFDPEHAEEAARLWVAAPRSGLSLGDRACLALARSRGAVAMTTDRAWADMALDVSVQVVR